MSNFQFPISNQELLKTGAFINGQWIAGEKTFDVTNPFNGNVIAQVTDLGKNETGQAIDAAQKAFGSWSKRTADERSKILRKWFNLMVDNEDDLATILTLEQGKPIKEALSEIRYGAGFVEWFAEEAKRVYGDVIPSHGQDKRIVVIKQPVGVVAAITPWNFPNAMITRKVAPALAAGCTVVLKPSQLTPLSALALAYLAEEAGIPKGVFNIVTGTNSKEIGLELTTNKMVKKVSFTGSTEVGKVLLKQSADTVKKVSMELGGNAPFIVFDDADIDAAVEGAIASKFRNAGQTCVCSNRIFAHEEIYDEFVEKLYEAVLDLSVGDGLDEKTDIGPLINESAKEFVQELIQDAESKGCTILSGSQPAESSLHFKPVVLKNAKKDMRIFEEEIFGPVAPVFKFSSDEEAIKMANDTQFGLASYFYGKDHARIWKVAEALEYGMVGINTGLVSTPIAPFGGVKESGFGREGSKYGIEDYINIKYMCWGGL